MIDTEKLRPLLEAATPGLSYWDQRTPEDEELHIQAVTALPALLDRLEKLEVVAEAARNANRLLNEWDLIRQHSYAHEALSRSLSTLDEVAK